MNRIIAHLDMDAFFASLEERNTPAFLGRPLVVGADPKGGQGRGVVSTANYKAREYGIHSAMPISRAWQLAERAKAEGKPGTIFVSPDFEVYEKSSQNVRGIIHRHANLVEQGSIDEFYFDLSFAGSYGGAEAVCRIIKEEIKREERVTCSVGIAQNKMLAKIAASLKKPDGFKAVPPQEAGALLGAMPVEVLPGVGPKTKYLLNQKGIATVNDLKKRSRESLKEMLGKLGGDLYAKARGLDDSPVVEHHRVKSIGEQGTFEQDTFDIVQIGGTLERQAARVFLRFVQSGFSSCKTIALTVRFTDFTTVSSSKSFTAPLGHADQKTFQLEALKLLLPFLDRRKNPTLKKIRLIGIRMERLS